MLASGRRIERGRQNLSRLAAHLGALDPLGVLGRGYALVQDGEGRVVSSVHDLHEGDDVTLRLSGGRATAHIETVTPETKPNDGGKTS